jgi:D-methionine transport system permease protein
MTRLLVGSSIGTWAAIIPLSLASILLIARATEDTFKSIPKGLIEMGLSMGASSPFILHKIVLPEALSILISHITNITITLIGFSAMAGTVGGGGLGDLAIRYGYQRYDTALMLLIVFILLCLVQIVQTVGERLSRFYQYH